MRTAMNTAVRHGKVVDIMDGSLNRAQVPSFTICHAIVQVTSRRRSALAQGGRGSLQASIGIEMFASNFDGLTAPSVGRASSSTRSFGIDRSTIVEPLSVSTPRHDVLRLRRAASAEILFDLTQCAPGPLSGSVASMSGNDDPRSLRRVRICRTV